MKNNKLILGFNIGNTNTTLGIYNPAEIIPQEIYIYKTNIKNTADELGVIINDFLEIETSDIRINGIIISSVVPVIDEQYRIMSGKYFNLDLIEISSMLNLGIKINYDNPQELGADRITNAVAVFNEYKADSIIIDLGTANTFCVLRKNGTFDGGLIAPGFGISIEALIKLTSKLPHVDFEKPKKLIAKNTIDAVKSGYFYSSICMLNGIIAEIEKEDQKQFSIILTGGFSSIISPFLSKRYILDPLLTMKGIKYIYNMNQNV